MCTSASREALEEEVNRLRRVREQANDSLHQVQRQIQQLDQQRFVGVTFAGTSSTRVYTYEMQPGPAVAIGDYVSVWSPLTMQTELVRVVRLGRGGWNLGTKIAHRIEITIVD